jgi:hypothetical protein
VSVLPGGWCGVHEPLLVATLEELLCELLVRDRGLAQVSHTNRSLGHHCPGEQACDRG